MYWDITLLIHSQDARTLNRCSPIPEPRCWHDLLRGFNLVEGFPINPRKTTQKGLEIPLDMMAFLAETPRATIFDRRMLLKSWATCLVPTARVEESLLWHFMREEKGSHLSYNAVTSKFPVSDQQIQGLGLLRLDQVRHFLGWCLASKVLAGTSLADYGEMDWSGAEFCSAGVAFEKVSMIGGQFLTGGASFVKGNRNIPLISAAPRHYKEQVEWLSGKNVVFYDVGERRAWLIDGALAMFHIMRTRMGLRPYSSSAGCKLEKLRYAKCSDGPDAGYNALTDKENMEMEVLRDEQPWEEKVESAFSPSVIERRSKVTITRFADLVTQTWYVFEEIFEHQAKLQTGSGINLRFTTRDKLEGFDFMDVVKGESPLRPRFVTLEPSGKGWVDLLRSIGAISLLGVGFGDLIVPAGRVEGLCQHWRRLPHGRDYLAASVSRLREIRRRNASQQPGSFQIAQGIYWHQHDKLFDACYCKPHKWRESCDRVQTLLPASVGTKRPPDVSNPEHQNGAVIFGRGKRCAYRWPKEPGEDLESWQPGEETDLDDEEPVFAVLPEDSGLGSSVSAGASHDFDFDSASRSTLPPTQVSTEMSPVSPGDVIHKPHSDRSQSSDLAQPNTAAEEDYTAPPPQEPKNATESSKPDSLASNIEVTQAEPANITNSDAPAPKLSVSRSSNSKLSLRAKALFSRSRQTFSGMGRRRQVP